MRHFNSYNGDRQKMSIYPLYVKCVNSYEWSMKVYTELLAQKEQLFSRTQPQGITYDKDKVDVSPNGTPFDSYIAVMEQTKLDQRIETARSIMQGYKEVLQEREKALRHSKDIDDRIFRMRYIDHMKPRSICGHVHYSRSEVYRRLSNIEKILGRFGNIYVV